MTCLLGVDDVFHVHLKTLRMAERIMGRGEWQLAGNFTYIHRLGGDRNAYGTVDLGLGGSIMNENNSNSNKEMVMVLNKNYEKQLEIKELEFS